jgi:hypothetical protein
VDAITLALVSPPAAARPGPVRAGPGVCLVCGRPHPPADGHWLWTGHYHAQFLAAFGRPPTWADAVAHCDERTVRLYRLLMRRRGWWSEPHGAAPEAQEPRYAGVPPVPAIAAETVLGA